MPKVNIMPEKVTKHLEECLEIIKERKVTPFKPEDFYPRIKRGTYVFGKLEDAGYLSRVYVGEEVYYQLRLIKPPQKIKAYGMTKEQFLHLLPEQVAIEGVASSLSVLVDESPLNLKKSLKVANHSPTGFNWGYNGSGPAQFALALLMRFVDEGTARDFYQDLKSGWVSTLPGGQNFKGTYNLREIMTKILKKRAEQD